MLSWVELLIFSSGFVLGFGSASIGFGVGLIIISKIDSNPHNGQIKEIKK